jgi:hypothetical protein
MAELNHNDAFSQVRGLQTAPGLGSRDRTRTYNLPVNSRTLCQLSYAGSRRAAGGAGAGRGHKISAPGGLPDPVTAHVTGIACITRVSAGHDREVRRPKRYRAWYQVPAGRRG